MKYMLKHTLLILLSLLLFTLISSLILTILLNSKSINYNTATTIETICSYLVLTIISFIYGYKIKKHGLINGLIISMFIIIISLLFKIDMSNLTNIFRLLSKILIILVFNVVGVNKALK